MAASMTFTYDRAKPLSRVIVDWVSDAAGASTGTSKKVSGRLVKAVTDPGAAAPTTLYDITLTDAEAADLLTPCQSTLANRSATATEQVYFLVLDAAVTPLAQSVHPAVCSPITVTIAAAGDSKAGQIILYVDGTIEGYDA